jgi:adenosylcobinamide-GDP ribazoletransferase
MHSFLVALAFLTVLPIRFRALPAAAVVARSRFWYPLVGLLLGVVLGGWMYLTARCSPPPVAAFLVLVAWVGLTGALHLDGLCDLCDGLFAGGTVEARLRIMKDPHLGTFGLAGGVLVLLGKFTALQVLAGTPRGPWAVGTAMVVARCLALTVAAGSCYPRPEGTGKILIEATRGGEGVLFVAVAAVAVLAFQFLPPAAPSSLSAVGAIVAAALYLPTLLAALGLQTLCRRRLGGITGDCVGAAVEITEPVFLLAVAISERWPTAGQ